MRYHLALVALVLAGCADPDPDHDPDPDAISPSPTFVPVASLVDVHGIAVHPEDPASLYVATHRGLHRLNASGLARVGDMQDDLMGFSMHPTDGATFWASGHPKTGGNMGVRQSTDGGFTWTTLGMEGVDFHAMAVSPADPERLWGHWRGEVHRSDDSGRTWSVVSQVPAVRAFAPHPTDPQRVLATGQDGILASADAGATWTRKSDTLGAALAYARDGATLYAGTQTGVAKSTDGGATWTPTALVTKAPVGHIAVDPTSAQRVFAAAYDTSIHASDDGGATWRVLHANA